MNAAKAAAVRKRRERATAVGAPLKRSENFSFRGTPELRDRLDKAAEMAGKTVSDVIHERLERSFDPTRDVDECFASQELFALMVAVAETMQRAGQYAYAIRSRGQASRLSDWQGDPVAFSRAAMAAYHFLERVTPDGGKDVKGLTEEEARFLKHIPGQSSGQVVNEIAHEFGRMSLIKARLAPALVGRLAVEE
jgi:predicted DNA-binding protein